MGFPFLVAAIRGSGVTQYQVARHALIPETRLSRIIRRGQATPDERARLARVLGVNEAELFAEGPAITLNVEPFHKEVLYMPQNEPSSISASHLDNLIEALGKVERVKRPGQPDLVDAQEVTKLLRPALIIALVNSIANDLNP